MNVPARRVLCACLLTAALVGCTGRISSAGDDGDAPTTQRGAFGRLDDQATGSHDGENLARGDASTPPSNDVDLDATSAGAQDAGGGAPSDAAIDAPIVPGGPDAPMPADPGPQPFLHPLFTDHMVLQRDALTPVWGWSEVGDHVSVRIAGHTYSTQADQYGRWLVRIGPLAADRGPLTLEVTGAQSVTLSDVQIGDVWLCSGQSNMVKILKEVIDGPAEVAASANPNLRFFKVQKANSKTPRQTLIQDPARPSSWQVSSPATTENFSAVCYFMGRELERTLGVPIGLITAAWGSTGIESWMSEAQLATLPDFVHELEELRTKELVYTQPEVTTLHNAMIAPLQPFGLKGIAWYQGEHNSTDGWQYGRLLPMFMAEMREGFRMGPLPFVLVQLPSYIRGESWPFLREAQLATRRADARTGLAVTIDVGNPEDVVDSIHPLNKHDVGHRLATAALRVAYGRDVVHEGPLYRDFRVEGRTIRLSFDSVGEGLIVGQKRFDSLEPVREVPSGTLTGFEIAGADLTTWVPAMASIDAATQTVVVSAPSVPAPAAVRYGWGATPPCNLYNRALLPASPFRTHPGYRVRVVDGSAARSSDPSGELRPGARVVVRADRAPLGLRFVRWEGDVQYLEDATRADTTLTMPARYVSLRAVYGP